MSKSKGNVIDPLEVIDKFGTDSFRFTLAAMAAQGRDIRLAEDRIEGYRHFVNKIWNATRFVLMNLEDYRPDEFAAAAMGLKDRWIISRLNHVTKDVTAALDEYKFNEDRLARVALHDDVNLVAAGFHADPVNGEW